MMYEVAIETFELVALMVLNATCKCPYKNHLPMGRRLLLGATVTPEVGTGVVITAED